MNKVAATRALDSANNMEGDYSVGFKRLYKTPRKRRLMLSKSLLLAGLSHSDVMAKSKALLENMTENQFLNWLMTPPPEEHV